MAGPTECPNGYVDGALVGREALGGHEGKGFADRCKGGAGRGSGEMEEDVEGGAVGGEGGVTAEDVAEEGEGVSGGGGG